jgi:hypothetical protein
MDAVTLLLIVAGILLVWNVVIPLLSLGAILLDRKPGEKKESGHSARPPVYRPKK